MDNPFLGKSQERWTWGWIDLHCKYIFPGHGLYSLTNSFCTRYILFITKTVLYRRLLALLSFAAVLARKPCRQKTLLLKSLVGSKSI